MNGAVLKFWGLLLGSISASAGVAFRWPEGTASAFGKLLFWYLVFIACCAMLSMLLDLRVRRRAP